MAGLTKIPAIVKNLDDKESSKVALIENLQRKDLSDNLSLLISLFRRNRKVICEEITNSDTSRMDYLINYVVKEMI